MIAQNKRLIGILATVMILLLIPLIAMKFTGEVKWSLFDFAVAGILLLGAGLLSEFVIRKVRKKENRVIIIVAILAVLFLVWAELAVGLFGTPFAGS